jgi:S-DNA-T family DNA segregation ATPase FtsK/SpoIIIE
MAKKRKGKKRGADKAPKTSSPFWRQVFAFVLVVLAIFILIGNFGIGGALPSWLGAVAKAVFGAGAYILPVAFVFWGVHKFTAEEHRIPFPKLISMIFVLITFSALAHAVTFTEDKLTGENSGSGGFIGGTLASVVLSFLDKIPASMLFAVLLFIAFCFAFGISIKSVFSGFGSLFSMRNKKDTDLNDLKVRAPAGFKLNEGVPVEHHNGKPEKNVPRLASLKNSAQKLTGTEDHAALTIATDPDWEFPSIGLLNQKQDRADAGDVEGNARAISETLSNFNIEVEMEGANIGPRVTQFTLKPPTGVKLTKITALESNIALDLAAHSIRIEAPIPGKKAVGIEVPNVKAATVRVSGIFQAKEWRESKSPLSFAIGRDIAGSSIVGALDKMPHMLIAGQTGSGKSVMINTLLTGLLYRNSPSDLKLIMVDPKQVELAPYNDIPHLLTPVIVEPEKCISALKWAVAEMERRYRTLSLVGKRNIAEYNMLKDEESMPYIVIVIDELADLMMMAARDVEALIVRIAQKARAVGIHLVLATQRPSVDVITGLIKANIPARIAFTVASQVDSRTIIDQAGAEKLLGMGDMLYLTADMPKPKRVQGALITDEETGKMCDFLRAQRPPQYDDEVVSQPVQLNGKGGVVAEMPGGGNGEDDMWQDAVRCVLEARKASTSLLQRRLRIGYGRAARLIEQMEEQGIVGPADGSRPREVLIRSMEEAFGGGEGQDFEPAEPVPPQRPLIQ